MYICTYIIHKIKNCNNAKAELGKEAICSLLLYI